MRNPRVLIVVPTLGHRLGWLSDCVASIQQQQSLCSVHTVVVAPTSADLGSFCADRHVEHRASDRKGLSAAINDGWRDSDRFDYLGWLGDDDLLAPGSIASASEALESDGSASAVDGDVRYIDRNGNTMWMQRPGRWAQLYFRVGKNLVPQQGSLFRSSAVRQVGGVDETFRSAMDQDLFDRLRLVGRLIHVRRELAAFRLHEANITVTKGDAGTDEGDRIRARGGRAYNVLRPITPLTDRLIYGTMRRLPSPPAPLSNGQPYTQRIG